MEQKNMSKMFRYYVSLKKIQILFKYHQLL